MSQASAKHYEESELFRVRHSAAHVMAQAVMELFPGAAKIAIGPAIADGFYYDFDLPRALPPEDLSALEARMRAIIRSDVPFIRREISAAEARGLFADQPYKLELIDGLEHGTEDEHGNPLAAPPPPTPSTPDQFTDLCRGPHLARPGEI